MNGENVSSGRLVGSEVEEYIRQYLENLDVEEDEANAKFMMDVFETMAKNQFEYRQLVDHFYEAIMSFGKGFLSSVDFLYATIKGVGQVVGEEGLMSIDKLPGELSRVVDEADILSDFEVLRTTIIGNETNRINRINLVGKLICVLQAIFNKYSNALKQYIKEELDREEYDFEGFCKEVIQSMDIRTDLFMPVVWERGDGTRVLIGDDMEELHKNTDVKPFVFENVDVRLVGPAGEGKTWAMRYLQYQCCQEYLASKGEKDATIAVMVELKCFNDAKYENMTIEECIMEKLHITDGNLYQKVMNTGKVRVFLDGYNEIFDENKKINVLNFATKANSSYRFVISDRETSSGALEYFQVYKLLKINEEQTDWYFKRYLGVESLKELDKNGRLAWVLSDDVRVAPYMLSVLVDLAKRNIYPAKNEFDKEYLKYLLKREELQQSTSKVNILNKWLKSVAKEMKRKGESNYRLRMSEAENLLREVVSDKEDSATINNYMIWADNIPIFGIGEDIYLQFKNRNYREYYADDTIFDAFGRIQSM